MLFLQSHSDLQAMFKKLLLLVLLFPYLCIGQDFHWARQLGDGNTDRVIAMEVDTNGNSYLLGESTSYYFDLDPGPGTQIVENNTINISGNICYLIKLDTNGNYVWGKVFNNVRSTGDYVIDVKVGTDNNIYSLMSVRQYDGNVVIPNPNIIIVKVDPSGNELMVKSIKDLSGNQSSVEPWSFDLDSNNNIYLTGRFVGNVTLDTSNSAFNLSAIGLGNYILKMSPSGTFIWVKTYDWQHTEFEKIQVGLDDNPNMLYHIFVPSTVPTVPSYYDQKLIKLTSTNGTEIWSKSFRDIIPSGFHIAHNGNYIITFSNSNSNVPVDIDPSSNIVNATDIGVILWLDSNGNYIDHKEYPDVNSFFDVIESDVDDNYYFATMFKFVIDADPSPNSFLLDSLGQQFGESYVVKFDSNRNFETAFRLGHADNELFGSYKLKFSGIKVRNGYQYYCGYFGGGADLDPSTNILNFNAVHSNGVLNDDGFALKLGPCDSLVPNAINTQIFCSSESPTVADLSPNSGSNKWYASLTSTTQLPLTTPLINGQNYYVSKQIGTCPESARVPVSVTINISPLQPNVTIQSFCDSDNATLSSLSISGSNLVFYDSLVGGNVLAANTSLVNNVTYYVSQTVSNCESIRTAINIPIIASTTPTISSPQTFCFQQNATINNIIISGQNIKWHDAANGGNLLANNTILQDGTTYYASQTINNCESSRVPVLITIQNTALPIGVNTQTFCASQNPTLATIVATGTAIKWYSSAVSTTVLPLTTVLVNGTTYYASQTINGCESINRLPITISLIFSLNANNYATFVCDITNNASEMVTLSDYTNNLISSTLGNTFSYYNSYTAAENQTVADEFSVSYPLNLGVNTIYVRIDSSNGCHQIVVLELTLVSEPNVTIPNEIILCENERITVNAGFGFDSYTWSTGIINANSIVINQPGSYYVTVTQNHVSVVCTSTNNFTVVLSNAPTITSIDTVDWTDTDNSITVNLSTTSIGDYEYSINGITFQNSNVFSGLLNGAYTVTVRDKNFCGIDTAEVFLLNYPKFFTPNNDGFNDGWSIKYSQFEQNFEVRIFDRYGKLLAILPNNQAWDGNYNGKQLPADDYWFNIIRNDGRIHKGHFALLR